MRVKILGCSGNLVGRHRTTSFLLDDSFLIDAGTVTEAIRRRDLRKIRHVLVSHTHMDHVKGLFPLVDELVVMGDYSVELVSVAPVLDIIANNLLNNLIWPDFTVIPSVSKAVIRLKEIPLERPSVLDRISVTPVLVTHTVYTVGFVVRQDDGRGFMFTADTGPTKRFWEVAGGEKDIGFIIADVSFPNRLADLATLSGHMTPSMLMESIDAHELGDRLFYVSHMKPVFAREIIAEFERSGRKNIRFLRQSEILTV
ncbi:MAG TPA: 3',5'-cyclic-nucleotide phosphodiesterase [Syntrophorhabdaceae bacterium]|nr:3',5'-cyclic-nucleotide phosphodiesterase [Syntrophorhabdaceae bacterium]